MPSGPLAFGGYEGKAHSVTGHVARPVLQRVISDASDTGSLAGEVLMAARVAEQVAWARGRQTRASASRGEHGLGGQLGLAAVSRGAYPHRGQFVTELIAKDSALTDPGTDGSELEVGRR